MNDSDGDISAPPGFPGFAGHPGMPQLAPAPPVMEIDDEPPNKKTRQEDNLIPEDVFMQCHKVSAVVLSFNLFYSKLLPLFRARLRFKFKFRTFRTSPNGS